MAVFVPVNLRVARVSILLSFWARAATYARLRRPANEAEVLPGRVYADPAFSQFERNQLFPRGWMVIAYESDVAEPGDPREANPAPRAEATASSLDPHHGSLATSRHTGQDITHNRIDGGITGSPCRIASNSTGS